MSEEKSQVVRQWVSMPGGSCDVRIGAGLVEGLGSLLRSAVGTPHACALVTAQGGDARLEERLRRQLTDGGFAVSQIHVASGRDARGWDALGSLLDCLGEAGITCDDLLLVAGDVDMLSLGSAAASCWCGGVPLAGLPTDLDAMVESPCSPRSIAAGGRDRMVSLRPSMRYLLCDPEEMDLDLGSETSLLARAIFAASAVAESDKAFEELWDGTPQYMGGGEGAGDAILAQALTSLKTRGYMVSSTSLATRQASTYAFDFAWAMSAELPDVPLSTLVAEGMRFAGRLSVAQEKISVDDMLSQDELLERLGLPYLSCSMEPSRMVEALRRERFQRSGRFLLAIPQKLGRVRLSSVDDDLLLEHVTAWCQTHQPQEGAEA